MINKQLHDDFYQNTQYFNDVIENFEAKGEDYGNQKRNTLKLFTLNGVTYNVKSFKIPNVINKVAYRFFRKSKAKRSYENALRLLKLGVGTPRPVGYYEYVSLCFFGKSYYISEHLDYDFTYRELVKNPNYPNREEILRAFTRFTYDFLEKQIDFLDHSPGNTLIINNVDNTYSFYLVDLNRMKFKNLSFEDKMRNFSRLTPKEEMIEIMSDEYSKLSGIEYSKVFSEMKRQTQEFYKKHELKQKYKRKLGQKK